MQPKIRATVICVREDKVLLVSKDGMRWALPGGRPDAREDLSAAAARELHEETALKVKKLAFKYRFLGATTVHYVFVATVSKSLDPRPCNEIKVCHWFSSDELDDLEVSPTTKRLSTEALEA